MSIVVFGHPLNRTAVLKRCPPGPPGPAGTSRTGFKLTSDGNYDISVKKRDSSILKIQLKE